MKSPKAIQRIALALTVILLLQEFSSARYIKRPLRLKRIGEKHKRSLDDSTDNDQAFETKSHNRNRRGLAGILLGTAIFVSLANIAFDVYLQIEGCCGLYPDACTYMDKFKAAQSNIEATQTESDAKWVLAEQKYTWVTYSNTKNGEIWTEVKRIMELSTNIVEVLDPGVVTALATKNSEIKSAVEDGNTTVINWSAAEISAEFNSLFDTQLGTLQHLSGVLGNIAELILAQAYGWYKKYSIRNMLTTSYGSQLANSNDKSLKFLGASDVDDLVSQTATSRYNYDVATTRGAKVVSFASGVMSLVQIGIEIFMAVLKVEQCKDTKDQIVAAYEEIEPQEANMTAVKAMVDEYYTNLTTLYDDVKSQVTGDDFLDYLAQIKNMTDDYGNTNASTTLESFISGIAAADESTMYNLQTSLFEALDEVEFVYDCLLRKAKAFANSASSCQSGSDTLENIYTSVVSSLGTNDGECNTTAGLEYTTLEMVQSYVNESSYLNGYQYDCILNNVDKQSAACTNQCDGYTAAQTTELMDGLTESQVTYLYGLCSGDCPLGPNDITTVCNLKGYNFNSTQIAGITGHSETIVVTTIAENCA